MATITAQTIRTLHVLDLENLASGVDKSAVEFLDVVDRYRSVVRIDTNDLIEVAVDASAWGRVAFVLPRSWRVRFGYGRDGADRAFLEFAEGLTGSGRRVDVVSRPGSLSRRLARAATVVVLFPEPLDRPPPIAVAA